MSRLDGHEDYFHGNPRVPLTRGGKLYFTESKTVEYKDYKLSNVTDPRVMKNINAFLNGDVDGVITIGVTDDCIVKGFDYVDAKQLDNIRGNIINACSMQMVSDDRKFLSKIDVCFEPVHVSSQKGQKSMKVKKAFIINIKIAFSDEFVYFKSNGKRYVRGDGATFGISTLKDVLMPREMHFNVKRKLDTKIEGLESKMVEMEERMKEMITKMEEMETRLSQSEEESEKLKKTVTTLQTYITNILGSINKR